MKKIILSLIPFLLAFNSIKAEEKPFHLFILSGQSNMQGMKPEAGFVPEAKKLFNESEVGYIKVAKGGRPIRLWVKEWNSIAEKYKLPPRIESTVFYQPILDQYAEVITKHPKISSVTFCWMQGERDAKENLGVAYTDAMKQLINNLRRDLKQPNMYFVIGRLSDHLKESHESWTAVRKSQVAVAEDDPLGAWVDCDDLNNKKGKDGKTHDDLHYTKEGYALLGKRYARQAKLLIDGKKPSLNGRPE
ncbi:MAG: acetyl xylan esterase [Verrucomicrobiales bacterium]|nr:acetyl xylan esterase [Verrucomicrobiales bacterium]